MIGFEVKPVPMLFFEHRQLHVRWNAHTKYYSFYLAAKPDLFDRVYTMIMNIIIYPVQIAYEAYRIWLAFYHDMALNYLIYLFCRMNGMEFSATYSFRSIFTHIYIFCSIYFSSPFVLFVVCNSGKLYSIERTRRVMCIRKKCLTRRIFSFPCPL